MKSTAYRYKPIKKKNKKMSFEKKVLFQSIVSAMLLVYCIIVSNTNSAVSQQEYIHQVVNITSTKADIKKMMHLGADTVKKAAVSGVEYLYKIVDFCNNGFGSTQSVSNVALAEPALYPETPQELKKKEEPQKEQSENEPAKEEAVFRWPLRGEITSAFGQRIHPIGNNDSIHYGIDIAGNHGDNLQTVYGHLSEVLVKKDEVVDGNTRIGSVGSTGAATGPHVHLEVRIDGVSVDPMPYLKGQ